MIKLGYISFMFLNFINILTIFYWYLYSYISLLGFVLTKLLIYLFFSRQDALLDITVLLILWYLDSRSALVPSWSCDRIKQSGFQAKTVFLLQPWLAERRELGTTQTIDHCGSFLITHWRRKTIWSQTSLSALVNSLQWERSHVQSSLSNFS